MFLKINNRLQNNVVFLFCQRFHSQTDLWGQPKLFLLFASRGFAVWNAVTLIVVREQRRREERGETRGGLVSAEEISSEHSSTEKKRNVRGRKVTGSESDGSYKSLLQWLFDPQLVWTAAPVKVLDINHLPLFQQQVRWCFNLTRHFQFSSARSTLGTGDTNHIPSQVKLFLQKYS